MNSPLNIAKAMRAAAPQVGQGMYGNYTKTPGFGPFAGQGTSGGGGIPGGMMPGQDQIDMLAHQYKQTGQLPPEFSSSRPGPGIMIGNQIRQRALELYGEDLNPAEAKGSYKANTQSLSNQQKILDSAESWERTGHANLGVLLGVAQHIKDTGSPFLNAPVRSYMERGAGDPYQTAFKAAHATVVNEYAKILSGAQGSTGVTDAARKEADSMLPLDATWDQLQSAAKILDTDAGNRIGAARQQVGTLQGRLGGKGPSSAPGPAPLTREQLRARYVK